MTEDPRDIIARQRAEMDQAIAPMPIFATALHHYYKALTDAGFSESQALELTLQWQAHILRGGVTG